LKIPSKTTQTLTNHGLSQDGVLERAGFDTETPFVYMARIMVEKRKLMEIFFEYSSARTPVPSRDKLKKQGVFSLPVSQKVIKLDMWIIMRHPRLERQPSLVLVCTPHTTVGRCGHQRKVHPPSSAPRCLAPLVIGWALGLRPYPYSTTVVSSPSAPESRSTFHHHRLHHIQNPMPVQSTSTASATPSFCQKFGAGGS